ARLARLRLGRQPLDRSAPEAQGGAPLDAWCGRPDLRRHAGGAGCAPSPSPQGRPARAERGLMPGKARAAAARYGPEQFERDPGVSRETLARLEAYAALLAKWSRRINLIGPDSAAELWRRHILDSAQLLPLLPRNIKTIADVGAGAGLPGLILSVLNTPAQ